MAAKSQVMNSPGGNSFDPTRGGTSRPSVRPGGTPDMSGMTDAFNGARISQPSRLPSSPAPNGLRSPMGGLAAKRARPGFKLSDITGDSDGRPPPIGGGGVGGAGLGPGRPSLADEPMPGGRPPPPSGTPFSNFRKIV